ncbi:MAG: NAD(P)/FAD-dependent oxidoreductase [bacterium]|nr:NAD(P)/FAD-dependent oxidoreductase [bacterium]
MTLETAAGPTWGIVGGGFLGMTLALRLARLGVRVTLFEGADHLGGLADAWQLGEITWDRHYHVILESDEFLLRLLEDLGLTSELRWHETRTGFYVDGKLHSMSTTMQFLRFPPLDLISKLRLGYTIWRGSKIRDWRRLEGIRASDWLVKMSGRRAYEKMWLPLLRAKLGENADRVSAAWIWAIIARMYAARRGGSKRERFGYVEGGYARILEVLEERLREAGVEVRLGCPIRSIDASSLQLASGETASFDRIAITTPATIVPQMCPSLEADEVERLTGIEYQGIVCTSLLLKKPLADYYVTNVTEPSFPFTGVIEMTALVPPSTFGGRSLVYLPRYLPAEHAGFDVTDDDLRREVVEALERMYPSFEPDDILAFRVSRVRRVLALTTLDYSKRLPATRTSVPGVFVVTSAQIANGTLNVNETIKLAEEALPTLLAHGDAPHETNDAATDRQLVAGS